jgi:hypothetical protein
MPSVVLVREMGGSYEFEWGGDCDCLYFMTLIFKVGGENRNQALYVTLC